MKNTSLLCLSSPEGDSNYYSALMNLKREGTDEPFFNVVECQQICKKCMKLERVKAIRCNHIKSTAHWLSSRKIKELKTLYKASPEDAIREFGGIVISDYLPALRKEDIIATFGLEKYVTLSPPKFIFTCCDPTGAGPSMLSLASGYYNNQGDVVVSFHFDMYINSAVITKLLTIHNIFPSPNDILNTSSIYLLNSMTNVFK